MAEKCQPKQNDCTKAGVGPECREPRYGGPSKSRCLQEVKRACEDVRENCIGDCFVSNQQAYQSELDAAERAQQAENERAAEAQAKCRQSKAYRDLEGDQVTTKFGESPATTGIRLVYGKIALLGWFISAYTGSDPRGGKLPDNFNREGINRAPFNSWDINKVRQEYANLQERAEALEQKLKDMCPDQERANFLKDECVLAIQYNAKIATCISECWFASIPACDTRQCYCDQYKCKSIDVTPDVDPVTPPTEPTPTSTEFNDTRDTRSFNSSLSQYDVPMELLYGREFLLGNVIWMSDTLTTVERTRVVTEFDETLQQNVGRPKFVIDNYLSFHVGLCAGPVDTISRVWLEGGLVYDKYASSPVSVESQDRLRIRVLEGSEASKVQAEEAAELGFGRVPAYRGLAGAFIKDMNISDLDSFPNLRFEVIKEIVDQSVQEESAVQANIDTSLFQFDFDKRRIYTGTTTGVRVVDYGTFELVRDITAADPLEVSRLPGLIRYDGDDLFVADMIYGDDIKTFEAVNTATMSFMFRYLNVDNEGSQLLGLMVDNDLTLYTVDDITGTMSLFATVNNIFTTGVADTVTPIFTQRQTTSASIDSAAYSVFLAKSAGTEIEIAELICYNTDQHIVDTDTGETAYPYVSDGLFLAHTIEDIFDSNSDVVLKGALNSGYDDHIIFFVSYDSDTVHKAVKWHPDTGVVWEASFASMPPFGKYSPSRLNPGRLFSFVGEDGVAYRLDLDTGETEVASTGNPLAVGPQSYDDQLGAVTYYTADDTFARVYADRVTAADTSVADIVRDIARRSGLMDSDIDVSDLEDLEVTGFRSGSNIVGQTILTELFNIYPSIAFVDSKLTVLKKSTANEVTISTDDLQEAFSVQRLTDAYDTKSCSVTYDSDNTDFLGTQIFSLPDDPFSGRNQISFNFTALLTDDYARALAEILVFAAQENDVKSTIQLPPRYLNITPIDIAVLADKYRVSTVSTGWDLSNELNLYIDTPSKYEELVSLTGIVGFSAITVDRDPKATASLLTFPTRSILPNTLYAAAVNFAPANIVGDFEEVTISVSNDEQSSNVGSRAVTFTDSVVFGRLVTPPPARSNPFTTQYNDQMVVKFASADMAANVVGNALPLNPVTFRYDYGYLYEFHNLNLLWVGEEMIQFINAEVALDGVTVTFTGLMRARQNTQLSMDHTAGELVVYRDQGFEYSFHNLLASEVDNNTKLIMTTSSGATERRDVTLAQAPNAFRDLGVYHASRYDLVADSPSVEFPDNPNIVIQVDTLVPHAPPFPAYVNFLAFMQPDVEVWLLRQDYDTVTFDAWRASFDFTDFSYVLDTGSTSEFTLVENGVTYWGYNYPTDVQDAGVWDAATEPLIGVFIMGGFFEETRYVVKWAPGDYMRRPMRGIRN